MGWREMYETTLRELNRMRKVVREMTDENRVILDSLHLLFPDCYLVVSVNRKTGTRESDHFYRFCPSSWDAALQCYLSTLNDPATIISSLSVEVIGTDGGLNHKRISNPTGNGHKQPIP